MTAAMGQDVDDLSLADVESAKPSVAFMANVIIDKKARQRVRAPDRRVRTAGGDAGSMSAWSPTPYRVYRMLWIALLASNIGTWMQAVGAAWMMVELDASPTIVALVQTATYLPVVVVGVLAGAAPTWSNAGACC